MSKIEIHNLTKKFGALTVLNRVTLQLEENHIYGLLGRNGAGKTTLLSLMTGRLFPDGGEVLLDGEPTLENDRALSKIYCMTEQDLYPEHMHVSDAFRWSGQFYPAFDFDYADKLCKLFELNPRFRIDRLSTGYNSIFKMIVALSCGAEIVILDEPVLGLDANHRELFYRELISSFGKNPRTFLLSTHLIEEVAHIIDHVIILKQGDIILNDDIQAVLSLGCTVSGPAGAVDAFVADKKVLGTDTLGGLKSAYLLERCVTVPENLELGSLDLQKLFIQLTNA